MVSEENLRDHNCKTFLHLRDHNCKTFLHLFQWGKSLKLSSRDHLAKTVQIYLQGDLMQNQVVKVMVPEQLEPQ
jgi:hypothetical protein